MSDCGGSVCGAWTRGECVCPRGIDDGAVAKAACLRLAQALRLIRDTTDGYPSNVAARALREAGIPDPPDPSILDGPVRCAACGEMADRACDSDCCPL